jgi:GT2 family glycosyltransferase
MEIAILMACHNRAAKTIKCIESLLESRPTHWNIRIYLVDDGSTDGTSEKVEVLHPNLKIIKGDGTWFWAHSMFQAESAIDQFFDAIIWLNDDVELMSSALGYIDQYHSKFPSSILVGQCIDPLTREITYGGLEKYDSHPFHYRRIEATGDFHLADTFHGNFVFIPFSVSKQVGMIDGKFAHAYADLDYGLRARGLKIPILVVPEVVGYCTRNSQRPASNLKSRFQQLFSEKGLPLQSQIRFLRRHGGALWPIFLFPPVLRVIFGVRKF